MSVEGWRDVALSDVAEEVRLRWQPGDEPVGCYIGLEHLHSTWREPTSTGVLTDVASAKTVFQPQDTLFGKLRPYLRKVVLTPYGGACSTDILVYRSRAVELIRPAFLYLVLASPQASAYAVARSAGTRMPRASAKELGRFRFGLPPVPEQDAIVELLDASWETSRAAAQVAGAAEALYFGRLTQLFSSLCSEHELVQLAELAEVTLGKMLSQAAKTGAGESPYLRNADIQWDAVRLHDLNTMSFKPEQKLKLSLRAGDALVCEGGEPGRTAVLDKDLDGTYFQKALHRVRCHGTLLPRFFMHYMWFATRTQRLAALTSQLTIAHLTREKLQQVLVPVPDLQHQHRVVQELDAMRDVGRSTTAAVEASERLRDDWLAALLAGDVRVANVDVVEIAA